MSGRWMIQTLMTSGWEAVGEVDGELEIFATKEEAEAEMKDHIESCLEAVRRGDMDDFDPDHWRVHDMDSGE